MCVGFLTAFMTTCVGLVTRVDEHVLRAVTGVGEATVTVWEVTLERLLSCNKTKENNSVKFIVLS